VVKSEINSTAAIRRSAGVTHLGTGRDNQFGLTGSGGFARAGAVRLELRGGIEKKPRF
jgi:hypothetical protein